VAPSPVRPPAAPATRPRQPLPAPSPDADRDAGVTFEALPRRQPFPRVAPAQPSRPSPGSSADAPAPARSPSSRVPARDSELGRGRGDSRDSGAGLRPAPSDRERVAAPQVERPSSPDSVPGARPIDRERVLERYRRPAAETDAGRTAPPRASNDETAVREQRDAYRADQASRLDARQSAQREREAQQVRQARDEYRAAQSEKVAARRAGWNADQQRSYETRKENYAEAQTREFRRRAASPQAFDDLTRQGSALASCHGYGVGLGLGLGFSWCSPYGANWNAWWNNCWPGAGWWWGGGYGWNNVSYWSNGWGWGAYPNSWWCHPFAWNQSLWWGGGWGWGWGWGGNCWPRSYANYWGYAPVFWGSVIANNSHPADSGSVVVYVDEGSSVSVYEDGQPVYEGTARVGEALDTNRAAAAPAAPVAPKNPLSALERGPDTLSRLANQYLGQGDVAFRERRYGDAVLHYAKAIEFRPNEGVMYLVLADALLATGDYHYGAFALRRALELDPSLASGTLDKHDFYSDPKEFDAQLQLLERFLADHPNDDDARILLAANYLFGLKPALAVDLLEAGASANARNEQVGKTILDAAKRALGRR